MKEAARTGPNEEGKPEQRDPNENVAAEKYWQLGGQRRTVIKPGASEGTKSPRGC